MYEIMLCLSGDEKKNLYEQIYEYIRGEIGKAAVYEASGGTAGCEQEHGADGV